MRSPAGSATGRARRSRLRELPNTYAEAQAGTGLAIRSPGNASAATSVSTAIAARIANSGWKSPYVRCTHAMSGTAVALAANDTTYRTEYARARHSSAV